MSASPLSAPDGSGDDLLSYSRIFMFWMPLGVMWVMMAVEQPALSAVIARLPDAQTNLAAFGVMFSLALAVESPIIQMFAAATAVASNTANYRLLLRFMHIMALGLTGLHLLIGLTPLYELIVTGILNVPPEVAEASRLPFIIMTPFSATVGYRRLWQGVLVRHGKTWVIPVTMTFRLIVLAAVLVIGNAAGRFSGAVLAAMAYSVAVSAGAVVAGVLNRILVTPVLKEPVAGEKVYTWRSLLAFYAPLALTTVIFLVSQPVVTFGIARGIEPIRSLAVFPVVNSYLFLFSAIGLSYQETAIALLNRSPRSHPRLSRFTLVLALTVSGLVLLTGLTPIGKWWFGTVSGLSESLLGLTTVPVIILSLIPALLTYKAWYRARFVVAGQTPVLAKGVVAYTLALFLCVILGSSYLPFVGVTVAAIATTIAQSIENGYLLVKRPRTTQTAG